MTLAVVSTLLGQQKGASISFNNNSYDFGIIKEDDGSVNYDFEFVNSGKVPLIIQKVIASCDCATANWPKSPLEPGARRFIKVLFNPKNRPGTFDKTITVYSNADPSTVVLHIKGVVQQRLKTIDDVYNRVIGDFRFKNVHIPLDRVYVDKLKIDTLEFICISETPVKIGCNIQKLPHLNVKFIPETLKAKEKGLMIITYNAMIRNDWGLIIDRFNLTQNDKLIPNGIVTISANIEENFSKLTDEQRASAPKLEIDKQNYDFGQLDEGQLVQNDFVFTNTGKTDLIIRKFKASCGCTTVEPADKVIKPGQSSSFKAVVRTEGFSGRISKSITLISNDPMSPSVTVRIVGVINPKKK